MSSHSQKVKDNKKVVIFGIILALLLEVIIFIIMAIQCGKNQSTPSISKQDMDKLLISDDIAQLSGAYNSGKLDEDELIQINFTVNSKLEKNYIEFTEGKMTHENFNTFVKDAANIAPLKEKAELFSAKSNEIEHNREIYNNALILLNKGNLLDAYDLKSVIPDGILSLFESLDGPLSSIKSDLLSKYIPEARNLISSGEYYRAREIGKRLQAYFPDDTYVKNILFSSTDIAAFSGVVQHIFFHPLIAYPQRAFDGGPGSNGQDEYMTTVPEFKEVLRQLYENNYVLIDAKSMFNASFNESGSVTSLTQKPVMIPQGKKPVIISVDDICYYDYMKTDGEVFKLVLDGNGDVATYSKDMDGNDVISKDNEVVPILDEFVKEHPDFSMNNVKGMLCVTSFNGILGYHTGPENDPQYAEGNKEVMPIVNRLKETGWYFASHGDGHRHSSQISDSLFIKDTDDWLASTRHLIGYTPLYVYPYGEEVPVGGVKFKYAQSKGFAMFLSVGSPMFEQYGSDYLRQSRRNVDGFAMKDKRLYDLFDIPKLVDPVRPWYQNYKANVWSKQ